MRPSGARLQGARRVSPERLAPGSCLAGIGGMDRLARDARYAFCSLSRSPGFAAVAVLTMALGIAGTTAVFAAFDALLLRPIALPDSGRLVRVWQTTPDGQRVLMAPASFLELRRQSRALEEATSFYQLRWNLSTPDGPERVAFVAVSAGFFKTLGVRPQLGRDFLPEEELAPQAQRVILTDGIWRRRL